MEGDHCPVMIFLWRPRMCLPSLGGIGISEFAQKWSISLTLVPYFYFTTLAPYMFRVALSTFCLGISKQNNNGVLCGLLERFQ